MANYIHPTRVSENDSLRPPIRLIAVDFDRTLIDWVEGVPRIDLAALEAFRCAAEQGILAGIVSGRLDWNMQNIFEQTGEVWGDPFPEYIVAREKFIS